MVISGGMVDSTATTHRRRSCSEIAELLVATPERGRIRRPSRSRSVGLVAMSCLSRIAPLP
jgi:hypothetical protein